MQTNLLPGAEKELNALLAICSSSPVQEVKNLTGPIHIYLGKLYALTNRKKKAVDYLTSGEKLCSESRSLEYLFDGIETHRKLSNDQEFRSYMHKFRASAPLPEA